MADMTRDDRDPGAALAVSEARLRRAQRVARLGSWELDLQTSVMWGSDEAFRIYGLAPTPDNSLLFDIVKGIPLAEDRPLLDRAMRDLVERGTPYELRFRIRRHGDGAVRHVHSFAEATRDESGRPTLVTGTIQDVTEYEEATQALQDALRANEERALLILEQAADAIFLGAPDGTCIGVNERACELTGYAREQLLGRGFELLFAPEVLAAAPLRYDLIARGETVVNERLLTRSDGSRVLVEMRAKQLSDGTLQAIVRDISERRQLEEQLQLRQRMDSIGTLAGGIAHDFNNILAAIVGYADALRLSGDRLDERQLRSVENILRSSQRAADLVRGLQMLSHPGPGESESFDLHRVASEVFEVLEETTDRIIVKEMLVPPGAFVVHGSASGLYHALMNLGVNAVQAIEQKGATAGDRVRIEAREYVAVEGDALPLRLGRWAHVMFSDSGVGMSGPVRKQAFDPLFTTKEKGERKGQGLGLAMVYNIVVRQHHGLIDVDSAEGAGSTFHLYLPLAGDGAERREAASAAVAGGCETVLVVDDERQILALTREALEQVGYTVLAAADGQEGLDVFRERAAEIDLVLLDRTLPKLPGEELLRRMLALRPGIRVIISSGDASIGLESFPGARRVLHKPYPLGLLYGAIRELLDEPA
jgi:PAS domain S-box-containing protein